MKEKLTLFGCSSRLSDELLKNFDLVCHGRFTGFDLDRVFEKYYLDKFIQGGGRYVINIAKLNPTSMSEYSKKGATESLYINCIALIRIAEEILNTYEDSEIVIIGSESGQKGSYDMCYFLGKSAIESYVRERRVGPKQRLIAIAPSTIEDSNMTKARTDQDRLNQYRIEHPRGRFLSMKELAHTIEQVFESTIYLTNQTIQLNGGKFSRMCS